MKRNYVISFVVMFLLFLPTFASAQLLKIGAGGGLTQVLDPESLTDEISASEGSGGAGFSTEWNIGLVAKIDIPMIPITPKGFVFYHSLSGSKEFPEIVANPKVETSQSVIELGLGAQYNFIPAPLGFDPYIALDLSFNSFGKRKVNDVEIDGSDVTRFGGGVGIGAEVSIVPVVNLDFYLSYKMFNLIGKEDNEETVSAVTLDAFIIFNFL